MSNILKIIAILTVFSLVSFAGSPIAPVHAVTTGADASDVRQSFKSDWVKQVDEELHDPKLAWTFLYDPRDPRSAILNALNEAAEAVEHQGPKKAKKLVNKAFTILEDGHRLGYYPEHQVEAMKNAIKQHLPGDLA